MTDVSNKISLIETEVYMVVANRIRHGNSKSWLLKLQVLSTLFQNSSFRENTISLDAKAQDDT